MIAWWAHFGLTEAPFGLTPDTRYVFAAAPHHDALETLRFALEAGEGFLVVDGEVGTGKTLLLRRLMNSLPASWQIAFVPNPGLDPRGLYAAIALEFDLSAEGASEVLLTRLERHFIAEAQAGRQPLVMIDEAQALPTETLEAVRLLTNLETERRKLLHVVLFGQPELMARLREKDTRQILTRISYHASLRAFTREEVAAYLAHRLAVAGARAPIFSAWATRRVWRASRGLPRLVNIIASKALMLACGRGQQRVTRREVVLAARDTLASGSASGLEPVAWGLALMGVVAAVGVGVHLLG